MLHFLLTHIAGIAGGLTVKRLRFPAGTMLGALAAVVLLNMIVGGGAPYPVFLKRAVQVLSGVVIGSRISREDIIRLKAMLIPAVILVGMLTGFNVAAAWVISRYTELSAVTALFAAAPGGMADLVLICADFGADPQQVTILQIFRFVIVVMFFPLLMKKMFLSGADPEQSVALEETPVTEAESPRVELTVGRRLGRAVSSLIAATVGGLLLQMLNIPAGIIIGAILGTAALNIAVGATPVPKMLKTIVQIGAGCYIGAQITLSAMGSLYELLLPMALIIVEMFLMAFVTGWVIHKVGRLDRATALFSCIPGGLTEMGIIAEALRLDVPRIVLMHTCRVLFVICMLPVLLRLLV